MQEQLLNESLSEARPALDDNPADMLRGLIGATALGSYDRALETYREAHRHGVAILPAIEMYLAAQDWTKCANAKHMHVFATLASLARDIDEDASERIMARCLSESADRLFRLRWESIRRFSITSFAEYSVRGLRLFLSRDLIDHPAKAALIDEWLGVVPVQDIRTIERLYVVAAGADMDYAGKYVPILFVVTIAWNLTGDEIIDRHGRLPWMPQWLWYFMEQHTLYHEIGHHVHRHSWGQDPEQERQANIYAWEALARARPYSWGVIYRVARILRPIRRLLSGRKRTWRAG
jgi:hypothetical protein